MATQTSRAMVSETSICNQALSWLGAEHIESLEEPNDAAQYCRENYPFIRDAVLEERMWTFALDRQPSTSGDLDNWGIDYVHPLPLDWLNVYYVYTDQQGTTEAEWTREGRNVVSPSATIYMKGVKRITDTGKFSNMFVQALAARLAAELARPLTENPDLQDRMWALYGDKLREAGRADRQGRNDFVNDIVEQALNLIGEDRIYDNLEQNVVSERLRAAYEPMRDSLLQEKNWSFARVRATSDSVTLNMEGYWEHDVPADWLHVHRVYDQSANVNTVFDIDHYDEDQVNWFREGAKIYSDCQNIRLHGIIKITDTTQYSPMFTEALVAKIAFEMAYTLTGQRTVQEQMARIYHMKLATAATRDSQQGIREKLRSGSLVRKRRG